MNRQLLEVLVSSSVLILALSAMRLVLRGCNMDCGCWLRCGCSFRFQSGKARQV